MSFNQINQGQCAYRQHKGASLSAARLPCGIAVYDWLFRSDECIWNCGMFSLLEMWLKEASKLSLLNNSKVPYEVMSFGVPVQVICRAQSTNLTGPIIPPKLLVSTPVVSSMNNTTVPFATPSSVFQAAMTDTNLPSAATLGLSVTTIASSISSAISGSLVPSLEVGGRKRRSVSSSGRAVLQYQFNNSAGNSIL